MIDRRSILLGGLAGLALPAALRAQPGAQPGRPGGPGPAGTPVGGPGGAAGTVGTGGTVGSRVPGRAGDRRDAGVSAQTPAQGAPLPQPPRIQALILSQSYRGTPRLALANTTRDAGLMARSFQRLRFDQVVAHSDGTAADTVARILAYLRTVDANTIALVYVAGHGIEVGGENLLLLEGGQSFLSLQALVGVLRARAGITILFLDACRNNPFARAGLAAGRVTRAVALAEQDVELQTVALGEIDAASAAAGRLRAFSLQGSGVKIVFSTDPANAALDDVGGSRNSPFAQALARHIRQPVSLDDIISLTTGDVIRATRRTQYPWSQGSIDRPIFLSGRRRRQQTSLG
jgi:uncharacterized caspase-like protein